MKLTEIVKKLMTETSGAGARLSDDEVDVREFENLFPWFDNYGIVVSLDNPRWVSSHGFWAEAYIAFEETYEVVYAVKGVLPTEEEKNIIVIGGRVKHGSDTNLELRETDQRLVILSYLFEKIRERPNEEADLFLRYTRAVPSIGIIGMLRFEPVYSKMPKDEQKRFLKSLKTESKNIPILKEAINLLDRSDIDVSYA
ncbi:MAG: hypothetical protein V3R93_00860 [Candidatus Hydrothermarchaeaceae archaeon]